MSYVVSIFDPKELWQFIFHSWLTRRRCNNTYVRFWSGTNQAGATMKEKEVWSAMRHSLPISAAAASLTLSGSYQFGLTESMRR